MAAKRFSGFGRVVMRNVDGGIGDQITEMVEQNPGFDPSTGAGADEFRIIADRFRDLRAVVPQDLRLGPGDVIFRQLANLQKEIGPERIVKEFARQCPRRAGGPRACLLEKTRAVRRGHERGGAAGGGGRGGARARRGRGRGRA